MSLIQRLRPATLRGLLRKQTARHRPLRRRTSRSAAKACGFGLLFFVLAHAAVVWNVHTSFSLRDPIYYFRARKLDERLTTAPRDYTLLAIGSSRMHNGFLGNVADETLNRELGQTGLAFNLSCSGGGPIAARLILGRLLENGTRPDHLVLELFPATMIEENSQPFEIVSLMPERVRPKEVPLLEEFGFAAKPLKNGHRRIDRNPWQELRYAFLERIDTQMLTEGIAVKSCRDFDSWGSHPVTVQRVWPKFRVQRAELMKFFYSNTLSKSGLFEGSVRALESTLELCRQNQIGVTLVWMPETAGFRSIYHPQLVEQSTRLLERLKNDYGCTVVMARDWLPDEEFSDGHHLYDHGGEKFTRRLCQEYLGPILARQASSP